MKRRLISLALASIFLLTFSEPRHDSNHQVKDSFKNTGTKTAPGGIARHDDPLRINFEVHLS